MGRKQPCPVRGRPQAGAQALSLEARPTAPAFFRIGFPAREASQSLEWFHWTNALPPAAVHLSCAPFQPYGAVCR